MAKVKYTAIVAQMSGKLAGSVFARCRYGNYIRTLTSPINSNSSLVERVRNLFSSVVAGWYNLSDDDRVAWDRNAGLASHSSSFGESFSYTGRAMFIHLNRNLQEVNEAIISIPPVLNPVEEFTSFSVDVKTTTGSEDIKVNLSPAIDSNTKVIIYATPILSRGSVYVNPNLFRKVVVLDHTFVTGGSIKTDYLSIFKEMPATGQRVAFKMKAIAISSGKDQYPMSQQTVGTA